MAMTDTILFVKEAKTCSYVLVVHTPRLCGEPGFKSRRDAGEEAQIRCREVVTTLDSSIPNIPEADHPVKMAPRRKTVPPPPPPPVAAAKKGKAGATADDTKKIYNDLLLKALEAIMGNKELNLKEGKVLLEELSDDGDVVVEYTEDIPIDDQGAGVEGADKIVEALRAAGFDVKAQKLNIKGKKGDKTDEKRRPERKTVHDDLDDRARD